MSPTAAGPVAPGAVTADDLPGLLALEETGFAPRERWSARSWTGELARAGALCLGVRTGGRLVAAGLVVVLGADAELLRIVVAPDHRGRAVATGLLDGLAAAAAARGATRMLLEVRRDNAPALALYRRAGAARIATRADYYGPGADALVLELALGAAGPGPTGRPGAAEGER